MQSALFTCISRLSCPMVFAWRYELILKGFLLYRKQGKSAILSKMSVNVPYFSKLSSGQSTNFSDGVFWIYLFIYCFSLCTRSCKMKNLTERPYSLVFPDPSFFIVFGLSQIKKSTNLGPKS